MIRYSFRLGSGARDPRAPFLVALLAMAAFPRPSSASVGGKAEESYGAGQWRMLPPLVHLDGGKAEGTTYNKLIKDEPEKYKYKNEERERVTG